VPLPTLQPGRAVYIRTGPMIGAPAAGDWRARFNQVYSLAGAEILKPVAPPFIPERKAFLQQNQLPVEPESQLMVVRWDGAAHWYSIGVGSVLERMMEDAVGLKPYEWDDPAGLLKTPMETDWVVRPNATTDQKLTAFTEAMSDRLGRAVSYEKRNLQREAVVVRGRYAFTAMPRASGTGATKPTDANAIIATDLPAVPGGDLYPQQGKLADFLEELGRMTRTHFIVEAESRNVQVRWAMLAGPETNRAALLSNLSKQTGLQFTVETRPADVWTIIDGGPGTIEPWRRRFNEVYGLKPGESVKLVPPPYIPERQRFLQSESGRSNGPRIDEPEKPGREFAMTVQWDDGNGDGGAHWFELRGASMLGDLPRGFLALPRWEMDGSVPWQTPMPGDWVVRKGATAEEVMRGLAAPASQKLGRPVHFEHRRVTATAIVVRGTYAFSALDGKPNDGVIELTDGRRPPGQPPAKPQLVQATLGALLKQAGARTGKFVVDETGAADLKLSWRDPLYMADGDALLRNVARQTGLRLDREPRELMVWTMVDGPAK
jgi:hypothetical protein